MKLLTKKGLLKQKPLSISYIYRHKSKEGGYTSVIVKFTNNDIVRELLFNYINSLPFDLSVRVLERQLELLKPLTLDEQIKIINNTILKGWKSLKFEYENIVSKRK